MANYQLSIIALALIAVPVSAQAPNAPLPDAPQPMTPSQAALVLLKRDTPVELMATKEVSTADVAAGTRFKLRVNRPVTVGGKIVVPVGASAYGEVVTARDSGGLGKSGRMTARLLHIQLGNAQISLDGQTSAKGTGAGSAGVAVLFTGLAGLFHRGNNAKIKAGELLNGFVAEDIWLDLGANPIQRVPSTASVASASIAPSLQ